MLVIIFILEMGAGIAAYVMRGEVRENLFDPFGLINFFMTEVSII